MSLIDMIQGAAGSDALQQIGARVGLSPDQLQSAINSLAPALGPKIAEHAATGGLDGAIGSAQDKPVGSDAATAHGNDILGTIFGSKDVSRSVAADASAQTGIGVDKLKALLPQLASVAMMAIAAKQASGGGLGGLLGSLGGLSGGLGGGVGGSSGSGGLAGMLNGLTGRS